MGKLRLRDRRAARAAAGRARGSAGRGRRALAGGLGAHGLGPEPLSEALLPLGDRPFVRASRPPQGVPALGVPATERGRWSPAAWLAQHLLSVLEALPPDSGAWASWASRVFPALLSAPSREMWPGGPADGDPGKPCTPSVHQDPSLGLLSA